MIRRNAEFYFNGGQNSFNPLINLPQQSDTHTTQSDTHRTQSDTHTTPVAAGGENGREGCEISSLVEHTGLSPCPWLFIMALPVTPAVLI